MAMKKGNLSINSENMLPIIKKWLYSDHDIFVREIVSNGCDAITKLNKLDVIGEYNKPADKQDSIHVIVNPEEKTVKFIDTGIGMTEQEVEALSADFALPQEEEASVKVGDYVQINDEGFTAPGGGMWTGVVKSIDYENKTVKVGVVGMYGSETVLEVALDKVEVY